MRNGQRVDRDIAVENPDRLRRVDRAVDPDPGNRIQSAKEMKQALLLST